MPQHLHHCQTASDRPGEPLQASCTFGAVMSRSAADRGCLVYVDKSCHAIAGLGGAAGRAGSRERLARRPYAPISAGSPPPELCTRMGH